MQTARVTVLMEPDRKSALEAQAKQLGVSSGEYIRLAVDNFDGRENERDLSLLVEELNTVLPDMLASLDRSAAALEAAHCKVDIVLRSMGVRK